MRHYNSVFNPQFGTYNEKPGKGKTTTTPKKGKVPSYNSKKSSLLQDKFDELVNLGVLIRPEDNNIKVMRTSARRFSSRNRITRIDLLPVSLN